MWLLVFTEGLEKYILLILLLKIKGKIEKNLKRYF